MKRPSNTQLLALALVVASSALIFRLLPATFPATTSPKVPAQAAPSRRKADAAMVSHQGSMSSTAMPQKNHSLATEISPPSSSSHPASDDQITASPRADASIARPDQAGPSLQVTPETATVEDKSFLPAIQLADDVRLPAALMPHQTANESPAVTAARVAIGERFYRELQEIVANQDPVDAAATIVIHQSPATENALKRANEEYRALFGDEAFNRKTMDTHLEVKLPTGLSH